LSTKSRCSGRCPQRRTTAGSIGGKYGLTFRGLTCFGKPYTIGKFYFSTNLWQGAFLNETKRTKEQVDSILEAAEDEQGEG
jgi:hypothetical protein